MDTSPNIRLEEIFGHAIVLPPAERASWLDIVCAGQPELRAEVDALLRSHEAKGFMKGVSRSAAMEAELARLKPEEAGETIGNYRLLEVIGQGGFGTVWIAEQLVPVRRQVALKILKLGMDTKEVLARFEQERQALAMMDHPNIAKLYDADATESGRPYFVMELVQGARITDYCDETRLHTSERLELFVQVCKAVEHAHQKGIIHRDLKPSNILVTLQDGLPVPKVIDFGVAKATQQRLSDITIHTELQQMIGTPPYMSPEQAEGSGLKVDTGTDVYALGVVLYELLTGRAPFVPATLRKASYEEIRRIILEEEPPMPSTALHTMAPDALTAVAVCRQSEPTTLIRAVRGDLDWIVTKALEKERVRRYETANDFARDVERHLQSEPVIARPPSGLYRFGRLVRRNRFLVAATGAIAATLIAGLSASIWQATLASQAAKDAIEAQNRAEASAKHEAEARAKAVAQEDAAAWMAYAANMNLIQRAWDRNEIGVVRELLNRTKDYSQRGFEWYYWQKLCRQELRTIRGHESTITALTISSDGTKLASGDDEGVVIISDMESGQPISVLQNKVSVMTGGRRVETSSKGRAGYDSVTALAFSPDGRRIAVAKIRRSMIYDLETNQGVHGRDSFTPIRSIVFSPDGQRFATVTDRDAYVWDARNGSLLRLLKGEPGKLWWLRFSQDQENIVVPPLDGEFLPHPDRWNRSSRNPANEQATHSVERKTYRYRRSPDGQRILTQGAGGSDVWNVDTGLSERTRYHGSIDTITTSPDGKRIVIGLRNTATVIDPSTGAELFALTGHSGLVTCVAYSPVGNRIVTGSVDREIKIWNGQRLSSPTIFPSKADPAISVFYPDNERILTTEVGSDRGGLKVWDVAARNVVFALKPPVVDASESSQIESPGVIRAAISPDGKLIATSTPRLGIAIWDAATGAELRRIGSAPPDSFRHELAIPMVFASDSRLLTGGFYSTRIAELVKFAAPLAKLWDVTTGRELTSFQRAGNGISTVAISHDSTRVLTGDVLGTVAIWDPSNGTKVSQFKGHSGPVYASAFFPKDDRFVTAGEDSICKIWKLSNSEPLATLKGHTKQVNAAIVDATGTRIVTGSDDGTIKVWDVASGSELLTMDAGVTVRSVALSMDGRRLLSATRGSPNPPSKALTLGWKIWEAASDKEVEAWQKDEARKQDPNPQRPPRSK
jgi:eukaryotic-like serine/threonine-protein kinase